MPGFNQMSGHCRHPP